MAIIKYKGGETLMRNFLHKRFFIGFSIEMTACFLDKGCSSDSILSFPSIKI